MFMSFKILGESENKLLKRKELKLSVEHSKKATPSRKELITELAKYLKTEENLVVPLKIESVGGTEHSMLSVYVYNKKEEIPKSLTSLMEQRISGKRPTPAAASPSTPTSTKQ